MLGSKRIASLGVLLLAAAAAQADITEVSYTFTSLTAAKWVNGNSVLTGVLTGDTASTTVTIPMLTNHCYDFMKFKLDHPATHTLSLTVTTSTDAGPHGPSTTVSVSSCGVEQIP
jgi:hypothetical protein